MQSLPHNQASLWSFHWHKYTSSAKLHHAAPIRIWRELLKFLFSDAQASRNQNSLYAWHANCFAIKKTTVNRLANCLDFGPFRQKRIFGAPLGHVNKQLRKKRFKPLRTNNKKGCVSSYFLSGRTAQNASNCCDVFFEAPLTLEKLFPNIKEIEVWKVRKS